MEKNYIEEQRVEQIDFSTTTFLKGDYEKCSFVNCYFSNSNLSIVNFSDCPFNDCNMSMAALTITTFRDCSFSCCKLLGLHFEPCSEFGLTVSFDQCLLNRSSFYKRKLKLTKFNNSSLHEVDFSSVDLTGSIFDNCDLAGATFENAIIEKADFRTAYNYSINPEINRIKKAKFSMAGIIGLWGKYNIEIE